MGPEGRLDCCAPHGQAPWPQGGGRQGEEVNAMLPLLRCDHLRTHAACGERGAVHATRSTRQRQLLLLFVSSSGRVCPLLFRCVGGECDSRAWDGLAFAASVAAGRASSLALFALDSSCLLLERRTSMRKSDVAVGVRALAPLRLDGCCCI